MAKNDMTYTQSDLDMIDEYAEAWSYYPIKASADPAKSRVRVCGQIKPKYSRDLHQSKHKQDVDELVATRNACP